MLWRTAAWMEYSKHTVALILTYKQSPPPSLSSCHPLSPFPSCLCLPLFLLRLYPPSLPSPLLHHVPISHSCLPLSLPLSSATFLYLTHAFLSPFPSPPPRSYISRMPSSLRSPLLRHVPISHSCLPLSLPLRHFPLPPPRSYISLMPSLSLRCPHPPCLYHNVSMICDHLQWCPPQETNLSLAVLHDSIHYRLGSTSVFF